MSDTIAASRTSRVTRARKHEVLLHVNSHVIRDNKKNGNNEPPIRIRRYGDKVTPCFAAKLLDKDGNEVGRIVYRPDSPTSCGAQVFVVTDLKVEPFVEEPYAASDYRVRNIQGTETNAFG